MPEFLDADKVLKELNITEADLTKLVSEGELVAFRDEVTQKLRFLSSDVSRLKESVKGKIYLTIDEVEKLSALQKTDIMDMVSEGKLQAFKDPKDPGIVKFKKSDVIKLIRKNGGVEVHKESATVIPPKTTEQQAEFVRGAKKTEKSHKIEESKVVKPPAGKKLESEKTMPVEEDSKKNSKQDELKIDVVELDTVKDEGNVKNKSTDSIDIIETQEKTQGEEKEDALFLEVKEETLDLNIEPKQEEEQFLKDESTSTEETDVDLNKLLEEGSTTVREEEEAEQEVIPTKLKKSAPKTVISPYADMGYEDSTLDMVLMFIILAVMIVIGVFVYDSFHILERGKIVKPTDFTQQIGQQVASILGAKDSQGNPIDLERALTEERKIGGKK